MTIYVTDPKNIELQTINKYVDFKEKNILEVGCGNGRLTYQFADIAKKVVAIDPDEEEINEAQKKLRKDLISKLEFQIESAKNLNFVTNSFDIALFSYSLCCMDSLETMKASLEEVEKKLNPEGFIVVLQTSFQLPFERGYINYLITNDPNNLIYDESVDWLQGRQNARFAVKYATLIEKKFDLITEENFAFNIVLESKAQALDFCVIKWGPGLEAYQKLDANTKAEIEKVFDAMTTPQGISIPETVVLTVLQKQKKTI